MSNNKENSCFYSRMVLVDSENPDVEKFGYEEGYFKRRYCDASGNWCTFDLDYKQCSIWDRIDKE